MRCEDKETHENSCVSWFFVQKQKEIDEILVVLFNETCNNNADNDSANVDDFYALNNESRKILPLGLEAAAE